MATRPAYKDWMLPPARLQRGILYAGPPLSEHGLLAQVSGYCAAVGYTLPSLLLIDYWIALKSSPFVVLFGPSGVGKTELARLFAQALVEPADEQYIYVNMGLASEVEAMVDLHDRFGWMKFMEVLETAGTAANAGRVFFLCLDNLRSVDIETYFSLLVQNPDEEAPRLALRGIQPQFWPAVPPNVVLTGTLDAEPPVNFVNSIVGRASGVYVQPQWLRSEQPVFQRKRRIAPLGYQRLVMQSAIRTEKAATACLTEYLGDLDEALQIPADLQAILWQSGLTYDQAWRSATLRAVANSFTRDGQGLFVPSNRRTNARFALVWSMARQMMLRLWGAPALVERLEQIVQHHLAQLPRVNWTTFDGVVF